MAPNLGGMVPKPRRNPLHPTHKEFSGTISDMAAWTGWMDHKTWNSMHSPKGFPDHFLVRPPRMVALELKIPPDVPSLAQRYWLMVLAMCGVECHVVTPDDWEQIDEVLRREV